MDNNEKKYTLNIYNTCTGCCEDVEVSEEVYIAFKRSYWNEKKSDKRYYDHTFPISALDGAAYQEDRFNEMADDSSDFSGLIADRDLYERMLSCLSDKARRRIELYYFYGYKMSEIAQMEGVSTQKISVSIKRAIEKMKKSGSQG